MSQQIRQRAIDRARGIQSAEMPGSKGELTWSHLLSSMAEVFVGAGREGCSVSEFLDRDNARRSLAWNEMMPPHLRRTGFGPEQMAHIQRCQRIRRDASRPRHICGPECGMPDRDAPSVRTPGSPQHAPSMAPQTLPHVGKNV